jgi:hypothetical protein
MVFGRRVLVGMVAGGLVAAGAVFAPAFGATDHGRPARHVPTAARAIGAFTPSAADPRLAALFARGGLDSSGFRFTPSETRDGDRAITVAVRSRMLRGTDTRVASATSPTLGLAPIAYNLGVAVGWKRFAVSGDVGRVELTGQPGSREVFDLGMTYAGKRFTGRVKAMTDKPIENSLTPKAIADLPSYSVDVGGSYALTRNLDVTAGMRYRTDRERLARLDDDRRDSQAVYVGTAFRF